MSNRLPSREAFSKLSGNDQGVILDLHQRQIEYEIDGLRTDFMWTSDGKSKAHHLKLLYARRRRLEKLAHDCGHWTADQTQAA